MDRNVDRSFKVIKEGKDSHNSQVSQKEQVFILNVENVYVSRFSLYNIDY